MASDAPIGQLTNAQLDYLILTKLSGAIRPLPCRLIRYCIHQEDGHTVPLDRVIGRMFTLREQGKVQVHTTAAVPTYSAVSAV